MFNNLIFDILKPKQFSIIEGDEEAGAGTATEEDSSTETGENTEGEPPPSGEIEINGKKYKTSDLIGADGLPRGHNKIIELERKQKELEDKILLGRVQAPVHQAQPQVNHIDNIKKSAADVFKKRYPDKDADLIDTAVEIATEIAAGFHTTGQAARAPIDAAYLTDRAKAKVKDPLQREVLTKWESEVDEAISEMPLDWKITPAGAEEALNRAVTYVKGKHVDEILADVRKNVNVRPRDSSTGVTPGSGSRETKPVIPSQNSGLDAAQLKDADEKKLKPKDYGYLLAKQKERDKAANRPARQLLGK